MVAVERGGSERLCGPITNMVHDKIVPTRCDPIGPKAPHSTNAEHAHIHTNASSSPGKRGEELHQDLSLLQSNQLVEYTEHIIPIRIPIRLKSWFG